MLQLKKKILKKGFQNACGHGARPIVEANTKTRSANHCLHHIEVSRSTPSPNHILSPMQLSLRKALARISNRSNTSCATRSRFFFFFFKPPKGLSTRERCRKSDNTSDSTHASDSSSTLVTMRAPKPCRLQRGE